MLHCQETKAILQVREGIKVILMTRRAGMLSCYEYWPFRGFAWDCVSVVPNCTMGLFWSWILTQFPWQRRNRQYKWDSILKKVPWCNSTESTQSHVKRMSGTPFLTLLSFFLHPYPQREYGRAYADLITKFSGIDRFPFFLGMRIYCACGRSAKSSWDTWFESIWIENPS